MGGLTNEELYFYSYYEDYDPWFETYEGQDRPTEEIDCQEDSKLVPESWCLP